MFQQLLKRIAKELARNNIPYMVIGGQAVLIHGEPRLTRDIDITLGLGPEEIDKIRAIITALKLTPLVKNISDFVSQTLVLPALDAKTKIRIDFIFSLTDYEREAIKRTKNIKIGNQSVHFASLEDVIIHKMIAKREKDIEDIKSIILKNPKFDRQYIQKWLGELNKGLDLNLLERFQSIVMKLEQQQYEN